MNETQKPDSEAFGLVIKGWLVTLPDGHECRLGPDETRARNYAAQNHATLEPMYVQRR
jgi:hypothetical protein